MKFEKYGFGKIKGLIVRTFGKQHTVGIDFSSDNGENYTRCDCYEFFGKLYVFTKKVKRK